MAADSDASFSSSSSSLDSTSEITSGGSSPKRPSSKKLPIISDSKRPVYLQFLILFFALKLTLFILAHISVLMVRANNSASDLILFAYEDIGTFDRFLKGFVTPFIRWDAVHMLAISKHGYVFELQYAFFPLLPFLSRYISLGLINYCGFSHFVSFEPLAAFIALLFTNSCHYFATLFLFKLTLLVFKSAKFSMISAIMFMFNPASIQLSAMYTEAPFALFTFVGLYAFYSKQRLIASLIWALASITRSNGIVLIGFFFYDMLLTVFSSSDSFYSPSMIINKMFSTFLYSIVSFSGFVGFQYFAYGEFCFKDDSTRPWCSSKFASIYSFVQKEYWNVGLFNYFAINQIPNFLFALPMIIICSSACFLYFESDHLRFISLGLHRRKNKRAKSLNLFYDDQILPHIYLLIFMLVYNVFVAHVQIITRVFTFLPVVYWFMAHLIMNSSIITQKILLTYIGIYGTLGTVLFALNYPPA
jgi:GPI mannosyltransferase 2